MVVLSSNRGELFVLRRANIKTQTKYSNYIPCIYCLGFLHVGQAYKHVKKCNHRGNKPLPTNVSRQAKLLISAVTTPLECSKQFQSLITSLKSDAVTQFVKADRTLMIYGNTLVHRKGMFHKKYIYNKLRQIGRFALDFILSIKLED